MPPKEAARAADAPAKDQMRARTERASSADGASATSSDVASSDVASDVYDALEGSEACADGHGGALSSDAILVRGLSLAPVPVTPLQLSRATEIQLFLEGVERIEIRGVLEREEDIVYYIVDIYRYQQQKGIPTRRRASSATPPPSATPPAQLADTQQPPQQQQRKPDYQIEQRYSSFARLRRNVARIARKRHPQGRACTYCHSVLDFLHTTPAKPCLKVKFASSVDERKEILGTFVSELVFAVREGHAECARSVHGYHMIPALVRRFLAEQTGANFFRY